MTVGELISQINNFIKNSEGKITLDSVIEYHHDAEIFDIDLSPCKHPDGSEHILILSDYGKEE